MARYKHTAAESGQGMFLTVNLKEQLLSGIFEYMLNELVGTKIDVSVFDENYKNNGKGASAIPPRILIKLILELFGNFSFRTTSSKKAFL